ncbi:MAG: helix-turn-helix transcriptional regulator [Cytophagales bacterium]|jgi:transcriptional regulator with XRE-family HTH domain|nr:helix-turn-helix transcriptional regulator [Cytophagales bacterium]MCA6369075.1 helix-turn-helix transcriptional regulator [Cytophagales bacterium]MCA6373520.1 helix-turn-helix transcriptional regulator [Cytophagales bacterium]MCA6377354.1 helix-turn-helix transcriptional regulator [Cytophagales bacterium]MCA6385371.1 helix-turn-helix transcriptional regulator [Cytophagales bacterium]
MKPVKNADSFGQRLKSRRAAIGISQAKLAATKELNTTHGMIGRYERDEVKPTLEVLQALSKALDTSVAYLVGESNYQPNSELQKLMADILAFPEKEQSELLQTIGKLVKSTKFDLVA